MLAYCYFRSGTEKLIFAEKNLVFYWRLAFNEGGYIIIKRWKQDPATEI